ncbi:MAG: hypothetical protein Q9181_001808 [Wetmoreana brouardii]
MTLEDFEKALVEENRARSAEESRKRRKHSHRHHHHHHQHHHHHHRSDDESRGHRPSEYRKREVENEAGSKHKDLERRTHVQEEGEEWVEKALPASDNGSTVKIHDGQAGTNSDAKRDAWMEEPSTLDFDFTQKGAPKASEPLDINSAKAEFELKIHDNELNKHRLQNLADGKEILNDIAHTSAQHDVDYIFGDSGAQWRMTKLKSIYKRAEETGVGADYLAIEHYGDLQAFDDAREEEIELERRGTYGDGYVGKEKPSGELFQERKLEKGAHNDRERSNSASSERRAQPRIKDTGSAPGTESPIDQTALNRLKAQMMKAKFKGSEDAGLLETQYNEALNNTLGSVSNPRTVVLGAMDNRMVAGGQKGEVKSVDTKRGRERGLVEENEDMSVEDMVREERRTRNQVGGDGRRFAERIAKDAKFDNDLEYMDENATKLAKRVQKSEINLKTTAIADFQKMNRILDNCPLCHHEDSDTPPIAPVVSLATRVYLTLPTEPEISNGGACIIPIQHRGNLLECDDDEWEEIRNFMKSLTRMYHDQGRDVIFYENASVPQRKKHAGMEVVPLPYSLGETASAFFKEAILTSDEEWTQHRKLIDTLAKAKQGLGKLAFRRTLAKEMPYFHVWFEIDGGLGHIVEDANRWPRGDLFAREVIGGMLDKEPEVIRRQGRWHRGDDHRVEKFRKRWRKFDWTRVLTDS